MTTHDLINAIFEGGGALFLCLNVRRLWHDRSVKGVSLLTTTWWTAWGFWNVYFYSAVNTPLSFYAGIAVVLVNAVWLGLAVYFARAEKRGWRAGDRNPPKPPLGVVPIGTGSPLVHLLDPCHCGPRRAMRPGHLVFRCECGGCHGGLL